MTKPYQPVYMNDFEAVDILKRMAEQDLRSLGNQVAWLIRQEYARRHATSLQQGAVQTQECADNLRQTCKEVANG